tara:strand:+ start:304 stop:414 length:111 start_codon:yes stop_codon:yes gene_type:complete
MTIIIKAIDQRKFFQIHSLKTGWKSRRKIAGKTSAG